MIYQMKWRIKQAEEKFAEALKIMQQRVGETHWEVGIIYRYMGMLNYYQQNYKDALGNLDNAKNIL